MPDRFLRLPDVRHATGLGKTTIYRKIDANQFPAPRSLGERAVGWLESEIQQWITDRAQGSSTP